MALAVSIFPKVVDFNCCENLLTNLKDQNLKTHNKGPKETKQSKKFGNKFDNLPLLQIY